MRVLEIIAPVLCMLALGLACKKWKVLSGEGIANMKALVTGICLPVAIFHALATAAYSAGTWLLVGIMLIMLVVSFLLGFAMKPLLKGRFQKYLPFMVSVYEGGLMAYPLFASLCGSENLSQIAVLDIAGLLFGFSVYMGLLAQVEDGQPIDPGKLLQSALHSPPFLASVLGILAGLTGIIRALLASPWGGIYTAAEGMLTAAMTPIILLVVGYSMSLSRELLRPCLQTILLRFLLQALMAAGVLLAVHTFIGSSRVVDIAIVCYMSAPATFSMQTFLKTEAGCTYVSTTNSLYCIVSLLVYLVLAVTLAP